MNSENNELNDIINEIENESDNEDVKDVKSVNTDALIYSFLLALQGITQVISDHTHLQSIALTQNDINTLKEALKPFTEYILKIVNFVIYLPFVTFAIGYSLRIISEIKEKKKAEKFKKGVEIV